MTNEEFAKGYKIDYSPTLPLRNDPLVVIHPSTKKDLTLNLQLAQELSTKINQLAIHHHDENVPSEIPNPFETSPASIYIMQKCYPLQAIKVAKAEGAQILISLSHRTRSEDPSVGGQIIQYSTPRAGLLSAYIQQGLAACPYVRHIPQTQQVNDALHIAANAAKYDLDAINIMCGYTTNYYDYRLVNTYQSAFIYSLADAVLHFLSNNGGKQ